MFFKIEIIWQPCMITTNNLVKFHGLAALSSFLLFGFGMDSPGNPITENATQGGKCDMIRRNVELALDILY